MKMINNRVKETFYVEFKRIKPVHIKVDFHDKIASKKKNYFLELV